MKGHQMEIAKIMHAPAEWVDATTPVAELARRMKQADIGALPVGKDDRLIGMVTDRDLALRVLGEGRDPGKTTAEQVMTPGIVWCLTSQTVEDALHMMEQKKIRRLPVIDEKKRLVGMLSLGDIADAMPRQLLGEVVNAVADHHP
jgi:CBS domain-containing protein